MTTFLEESLTEKNTFALLGRPKGRGELVLGGVLVDPADQALLVFCVEDKSVIEEFVRKDPYVNNGLVNSWENSILGSGR